MRLKLFRHGNFDIKGGTERWKALIVKNVDVILEITKANRHASS